MSTPSKGEAGVENLYEIASCTICLQEMTEDLASLSCGHCFHLGCISQHFEYRGTCPNCQKRACLKEVRTIVFPLTLNTKANAQLRALLASMDSSERKQMEQLIEEIKREVEKNEQLKNRLTQSEKDCKTQAAQIESMKEELGRRKNELETLRKQFNDLYKSHAQITEEGREADRTLAYLRCEVERYQKQEKDYETMRKLRKIMSETSSELMKYKSDLEAQSTPPEEMAKLFYDMLMMKNLEVLKAKDKLNEFPDKLSEKDHEIVKLRSSLEAHKKEIKDNFERKAQDRRRYEDLKNKYRTLLDKAKQKGLKGLDVSQMDENSQTGLPNLVPQAMVPEPIMQETLRKPAFNSNASGKIGGFVFKKKAESSGNIFA